MKNHLLYMMSLTLLISFMYCDQSATGESDPPENAVISVDQLLDRGQYLVTVMGCNDCHTPKKLTEQGPVPDMERMLMGHPSQQAIPEINAEVVAPGGWLLFNSDLTAAVGPWGVSFAANLTPHETGLGAWTYDHFKKAMTEGKHKGLDNGRMILPPMPWQGYQALEEDDLKGIYEYLKSIPPIENIVPAPIPPTDL